ncbi:MAG: T9SS type B sorting domain-containing protein [Bacteroidota bacterium]
MKFAFLAALLFCCNTFLYSQNKDTAGRQNFIEQILKSAGQHSLRQHQFRNNNNAGIKIPVNFLSQPINKQILKYPPVKNKSAATLTTKNYQNARVAELCKDTSYTRLLGVNNSYAYVHSVKQLADGGILVSLETYDSTHIPNTFGKSYGVLLKLDGDGNVVWLKQFENLDVGTVSFIIIDRAFELSNHDIICTGLMLTNGSSDVYTTSVFRLTSTGNIIWQNHLKTNIGIFNSGPGTFTYYVNGVAEGLNGDIILSGESDSNLSSGKIETVVRLNNLGQLVWDANFGNHGDDGSYRFGAEGVSVYLENGKIVLAGLSHGSNNPITPSAVNFFTLDYNNGSLLSTRFFRPEYADDMEKTFKGFVYWGNKCIRLANGHILFYGKLISDIVKVTPIKDHFGVIEFDASFNLVNAYTISSGLTTNYYNNVLDFDPSGKGLVSVFEFIDAYKANIFFGAFNNQQFQKQRKAYYGNAGLPPNNGFAWLKDNGYAYVQSYIEDQPASKYYFEFRKMHNSDTSSQCLGKDTTLLSFLPLNIIEDPGYTMWDANDPNKMQTLPLHISQTDTTLTNSFNPCKQTNFCDTVKIHGDPVICGNTPSITFTAFKNQECGGIVQWDIDKTAIDSLQVLSDSSVRVWFKNINWQGKLYASLPGGACYMPANDSVMVSITRSQASVNLGPDTILCDGNSIVLRAGKGYSTYQWQDGSIDSILTVTTPGMYWVHTTDFCGNNFADSIMVSPFAASVNIGPDRIKCNSDTLHLEATPGFLNYIWGPTYNINSLTASQVIVQPAIDTFYFVRAEKAPGCFAYDTVKIKVNLSAPINLGADKSFCAGDSAVLNAGVGFSQYQWNNGSSSQQIFVLTGGEYSITGTAVNGCKSYDTLKVNVWPNPVVTLNDNPGLCKGATRRLIAGNYATYLWQNGNSSPSILVSDTGTYYVKVSDYNQCTGSDTVHITTLLPVPANFLPADTAICRYGNLVIQSTGSYSNYNWSNNSSSPSISITSPGIYWLEVTDARNCTGKDSILINLKECLEGFVIPTAFTPDMNGRNDYFKPFIGGTVKQYLFTIYNRWGQVVFTTKDQFKGWDGTFRGVSQYSDVFVWTCVYQIDGEGVKKEKGTVLLVK